MIEVRGPTAMVGPRTFVSSSGAAGSGGRVPGLSTGLPPADPCR